MPVQLYSFSLFKVNIPGFYSPHNTRKILIETILTTFLTTFSIILVMPMDTVITFVPEFHHLHEWIVVSEKCIVMRAVQSRYIAHFVPLTENKFVTFLATS